MQTPSHGVAQPLQNHVHLISGHRFPHIPHMSLEQAFRYLIDAPQIVKQIAPMSWEYVTAPQDGMLWLEWLPQDKSDRFPSDGYVWGDVESRYRHEFGGYTIEMMIHTIGYRMQYDQMAAHARTRYHLLSKNPSVNAAPPDPSLWLVHYHQAEPGRILPSSQVPFTPQMQQIMQERRWLETQGKLEKRDFMLHDRASWPLINVPSGASMQRQMQQPGFYGPQVQQNRYPNYYPQQAGQQPPQKKQRPNPSMSGPSDGHYDTSIEDEENTTLGDFFDHLTPRDISMMRYQQHHHWMEEVFSSPYASHQIVPPDLGLGLMGELKGLTDGILEPPSVDLSVDKPATTKDAKLPKAKDAQPFTNLKPEQLEEFNKRVAKHLEEGQAEIDRMKVEHAAKMQAWKKSKTLMQAEKRLRYATWEGHEAAVPVYRLEEPQLDGQTSEGAGKETIEEIISEVEGHLGVKVSPHKDANMVEKGGLEKEEEQPKPQLNQDFGLQHQQQTFGQHEQSVSVPSVSSNEPTTYHQDPSTVAPMESRPTEQMAPPSVPQPSYDSVQQPSVDHASSQQPLQQAIEQQPTGDLSAVDMADTSMMEGMDLDIDDSNLQFDEGAFGEGGDDLTGATLASGDGAVQALGQQSLAATATSDAAQAEASGTLGGSATEVSTTQSQQQNTLVNEAGAALTSGALENTLGGETTLGDNSMFNDSTFDDFTNMDNDGGDELIDFGGGDMGMDDSAFGAALHGMDDGGAGDGEVAQGE